MRTSNPTLSDSAFQRLGAGQGSTAFPGMQQGGGASPAQQGFPGQAAPFGPAPGPSVRTEAFTVEGAIYKTMALLGILVVTAVAAMVLLPIELYTMAIIGGAVAGLVVAIVLAFKPDLAPVLAPLYAVVEGVFLGAITVLFEQRFPGIATQALVGTLGVLGVMLVLYRTGVIRVTQRFRMIVLAATGAIFVTYLVSFVLGFFGVEFGFLHGNSWLSIGISLVIIGVAAANLALDFDFIENAARAGLPAKAEWYAAFGLLVTLVWLYLEILRLLSKINSRN